MSQKIIIKKGDHIEVWSTFTGLCRAYPEFKYHYLKRLSFPFKYKFWEFYKLTENERREIPHPNPKKQIKTVKKQPRKTY